MATSNIIASIERELERAAVLSLADWRNDSLSQLVHKVVDTANAVNKQTGEVDVNNQTGDFMVDGVRQFRRVDAIVRTDGSVSIYLPVGGGHNVLYDTLDTATVDVNKLAEHAASVLILACAKRGDINGTFDPAWMSPPIAEAIQTALVSHHTQLLARNASLVNVCNERLARMERAEAQLHDLMDSLATIRDKADEVRNDAVAATDATLAVLDEAKRR